MTKEEKALESLIKVMTEINQFVLNGNPPPVTDKSYQYAMDALKANGWRVVGDEWNISRHIKIDA